MTANLKSEVSIPKIWFHCNSDLLENNPKTGMGWGCGKMKPAGKSESLSLALKS